MPALEYLHVDVFSPVPFGGNSLPVFWTGADLDAATLLAITRELRHFEAIFLQPTERADTFHARVFDLLDELSFAGHPLLGAAAALHHRSGQSGPATWRLVLGERMVPVSIERVSGERYSGLLDAGQPEFLGEVDDREAVARAFALESADLLGHLPLEVVSTGLRYLIVPVTTSALVRARIDSDISALLLPHNAEFAVLLDEAGLEIRHWNNDGIVEDIATGSAAATIGAYRLRHRLAIAGVSFKLQQGRFVGRPSQLTVRADGAPEHVGGVHVGGEVAIVGYGALTALPGTRA